MKKKIVLIDRDLELVKSVYESEEVSIEFLIVESAVQAEEARKLYNIPNIIPAFGGLTSSISQRQSSIDYKYVEKFKATQLKSEHFYARASSDSSLIQYYYYDALFFWIKVFETNTISAVVLSCVEHGGNHDSLILDAAESQGVPGFVFDTFLIKNLSEDRSVRAYSVLDRDMRRYIPLNHNNLDLNSIDLNSYLTVNFSNATLTIIKKMNRWLPISYTTMMSLYFIIQNRKLWHLGMKTPPFKLISNNLHMRKVKRFYDSISVELDTSKKYVFYALHFEPEANIMIRSELSSQLTIIRLLSQSLPKGWVLYVKDHPGQFKLANKIYYGYLASIHKYRTKEFYQEILKLNNTKILDINTNSSDIVQFSEAVATINGTVALEAVAIKKPVIIFGPRSTPLSICKDIFGVTSFDQCKNALSKLEDGFRPNYSDLDQVINDYVFEFEARTSPNVQLLINYLVCEYCPSGKQEKHTKTGV